jgi:hypothetical protein
VGEHPRRGRHQRRLIERQRDGARATGVLLHAREVEGEEGARRKIDEHRHRVARALVRQRTQRRVQAPLGGLVAAEEVLAGGARRRQSQAQRGVLGGNEIDRLEQRRRARLELPGRLQHAGEPQQRAEAGRPVAPRDQP